MSIIERLSIKMTISKNKQKSHLTAYFSQNLVEVLKPLNVFFLFVADSKFKHGHQHFFSELPIFLSHPCELQRLFHFHSVDSAAGILGTVVKTLEATGQDAGPQCDALDCGESTVG
jgi:hypothetical protein